MIEETGHVVRTEDGFAWVETERRSACQGCSAQNGCGTGVIGRLFAPRRTQVRALNAAGAQIGDEVVLGLAEHALVSGSLALYAAPLLTMLGGSLLFEWVAPFGFSGDGVAISGGLVGFAAGLLWVRRFAERIRTDERYQPVILRRVRGTVMVSDSALLP